VSDKKWLSQLLDGYLSIGHVNGERPCPLAFLTTDIIMRDSEAKTAYSKVYDGMNKKIMAYASSYTQCSKDDVTALTAMIIGAVAIARTINDKKAVESLLSSCRREAGIKLGGI
jgi:hypothetical protein